jgi:hypothetical protein
MSLGYGGVCRKALEDEETVIYTYRGENLNLPRGEEGAGRGHRGDVHDPEVRPRGARDTREGREGPERPQEARAQEDNALPAHRRAHRGRDGKGGRALRRGRRVQGVRNVPAVRAHPHQEGLRALHGGRERCRTRRASSSSASDTRRTGRRCSFPGSRTPGGPRRPTTPILPPHEPSRARLLGSPYLLHVRLFRCRCASRSRLASAILPGLPPRPSRAPGPRRRRAPAPGGSAPCTGGRVPSGG